jgi:protein phosphatase
VKVGQRAGETNAGRKRRRNEDSFVCDPPLFAVADGMGGAQAGEVASSLAAAALRERGHDADGGGEQGVVDLIQEANRRVHQRALDDEAASGMGTTITAALFQPAGSVAIGHVGDSRAYRLRAGRLEQLTDDHSLVAELVRRGELSPEEAEVHPQRSVITRALGTDPDVDVDVFTVEAQTGDLFLLCSDGLTTMVDADTIGRVIERNRTDLHGAARALIDEANARGGDDNITAVLFDVAEGEQDDATAETVPITPPDEEDTLHPGDEAGFVDGDTSIVSVEELRSAMAAHAAAAPAAAPPAGAEAPRAALGQYLLALLVIVVLAGLIVLLVLRGLAR